MQFNKETTKKTLTLDSKKYTIFSLNKLKKLGIGDSSKLPFSIKILLESAIRNFDGHQVTFSDIKNILNWKPKQKSKEIAFKPSRVLLQDFTGVPCIVDLAAMRDGMKALGGNYKKINPQVPCDLIIDHSLQIDYYGDKDAARKNVALEFKRNKERYQFLKWGESAFKNFKVIPPSTGIIHQINLEYLAKGVFRKKSGKDTVVYPDSLVGTDSHTTMINGIGIVGWGVGGIEAEAVMLGEPIYMILPQVVGFKLKGKLKEGVTATDLVLTIVEKLRKKGVVGKFVEFFGQGIKHLSLPDRAVISNMCPEYGATLGIFPIDQETLNYYKMTGRKANDVRLIEKYTKEQGMFYDDKTSAPKYSDSLELDLSKVEASLAGPKRPQDRIVLKDMKAEFKKLIGNKKIVEDKNKLQDGSIVIASITSCTNTSNPSLVVAAGLIAKNAALKGLKVKDFVKTSFAPGSLVIEEYLKKANLLKYLEQLKFHIVGYGCATCIGNSGPLDEKVVKAIRKNNLTVASVLSGNRNFEGRISPHTKANYLASPPLVVAYALAGSTMIDFDKDPLGQDKSGRNIYLKDIWPKDSKIKQVCDKFITSTAFNKVYKNVDKKNKDWNKIKTSKSDLFKWNNKSTYIQEPPFFKGMKGRSLDIHDIKDASVLIKVGDSITTDHISPAGVISENSPAGKFLKASSIKPSDFNSYGSRRGNDQVMTRGTFANIRLKNQMAKSTEGSFTTYLPTSKVMSIYDASLKYKKTGTPLVVLAGSEYGTGSSRDWAAKGTALLGVRVVLAESFERIHRSNLAGMGILPLQFKRGQTAESLKLSGNEAYSFLGIDNNLKLGTDIIVRVKNKSGKIKEFKATVRLDTPVEIDYFKNGGILQTVLRKLA
ncbi:MAG: aconitate hydratase AcnA [Candidatus Zapsychrus exili]|nr:aconitate hydratase AcnA [Candidatus Zapsychrus exili]